MKIYKYTLEIAVFVCGAVVMIFELVGSRILGPYFGTSIFVWSSLIGIILGSLSLGYYLGGKLADKKSGFYNLSLIIFLSSIFIGLTILIKDPLLGFLQTNLSNIKISSVFASLIIFSITLIIISVSLSAKKLAKIKLLALIIFLLGWTAINQVNLINEKNGFIDIDTAYNRIWIYNYKDAKTNKLVKIMGINNEPQSSMFLDSNELVNEYAKYFHLAKHFNPNFKTALILGGAGYSYPKDYLLKYPESTIDVIEIDPMVTELAKKYFNLKENPRLNIYHKDGRAYLNTTQKKYDVIFGDAFTSLYSLPYQLTTKEAVQKKYDILNNNGVVILNIASSLEGKKGKFLRAEYATYKDIFPQVYLFPVTAPDDGKKMQNIILVALKSEISPNFNNDDVELNEYLQHLWQKKVDIDVPILTDDCAPVEYYINKAI